MHQLHRIIEHRPLGVRIAKASPPDLDFVEAFRVWGHIAGYELAQNLPRLLRTLGRPLSGVLLGRIFGGGVFTRSLVSGLKSGRKSYRESLKRRAELQLQFDRVLFEHDVWITPVASREAIRRQRVGKPYDVDGQPELYTQLGAFLCPTALFGHPIVTVPIGRTESGLPVSLQFHGKRGEDFEHLARVEELALCACADQEAVV